MTFARTKIQPPRARPGALLPRPGLQRRLAEAFTSMRLVLLCATAGFGKTSAVTQALELLPKDVAVAWVGCDEADSLQVLFECLVGALDPYDLPWRSAPEALIAAATATEEDATARQRAPREWVDALINALDAAEVPHGVIVVDDLHRIDDPAVLRFFEMLLERFTPRWTLVIASREEPPIGLARLRARAEVAEFRMPDLRLEPAQVRELAVRACLDERNAAALVARTDGWPAGIQLALNVLRGAPGASLSDSAQRIDRQVFEFLASEVLDRLSPTLRRFLMLTSVLPELTAARCAALTGDANAALHLDAIEHAGLFVTTLAGPETTLRLHDLFRDALEHRLLREHAADLADLFQRAAASEPDGLRRVGWLQRAGAWPEAEAALMAASEDAIAAGDTASLLKLHERFPAELRRSSPRLQLLWARTHWDWDTVIETTERAAAGFAAEGDRASQREALTHQAVALAGANRYEAARAAIARLMADPLLDSRARLRLMTSSAWLAIPHGDQRALAPLWSEIVDGLMADPQLALWSRCVPRAATVGLPGTRGPLQRFVAGTWTLLPEQPTPLRGLVHVLKGWLQLWVGDVDGAQACAEQALQDNRWLARPATLDAPARALQAVLHAVRGGRDAALAGMRALIEAVADPPHSMRSEVFLDAYRHLAMRVAGCVEAPDECREMAQALAAGGAGRSWLSARQRSAALAHLGELDERLDDAQRHWQALVDDEHHADLNGQLNEARARVADLCLRRGLGPLPAAMALRPLFARVAADGEWGALLLSGPALLRRLAAADWRNALAADEVGRLREWAAGATRLAGGGADTVAPRPSSNALSPRELEVLQRLAAGDSNKLIARGFDLSPHTVKRHVANILDKLELRSRGQAAAWYHERYR